MSCRNLYNAWSWGVAFLVLAAVVPALAKENEPADEGGVQQVVEVEVEPAADEAAIDAIAGQDDVPAKGDSDAARRERDLKALLAAPGDAKAKLLQERAAREAERAAKRGLEFLQQRQQAMSEEQRLQAGQQMRKAMAEYERAVRERHPELEQAQAMLEQQMKQLEIARVELVRQQAQLQAAQLSAAVNQQQQSASLPKDGTFQVFPLRYGQAVETAQVLSEILGGTPMRLAVDGRTNSLLVFADKDTTEKIRSLVENLDARPVDDKGKKAAPAETLQLRMVWLLDGIEDEGQAPPEELVGPQVVDALHELGFGEPKVVCQQVTTLTLSDDERRGNFNFQVPVLINSQPWQFDGSGEIEATADERLNVRFNLQFQQQNVEDRAGRSVRARSGQLGGSIHTPKGHYTVMGTTTFVATSRTVTEDGIPKEKQQQHLSAFVVYLDRARTFPADHAEAR